MAGQSGHVKVNLRQALSGFGGSWPHWHAGWENVAGHQACLAHILRDYQDAAETYPDAHWPAQAQRALRGLIRAWNVARDNGLAAIPGDTAGPLSSGAPSPSACPPCPASPARRTPPPSGGPAAR